MPPRSRKPQQKTIDKAAAGLADFLKFAGIEVDEAEVKEAFNTDNYKPQELHDTSMLQAEGVLLFIQNAARSLLTKKCKECGDPFATQYINVAYCSNLCRGKAMSKVGILWDYTKDHYRAMDADRPLVIGTEAYQVLLEFAIRLTEGHQALDLKEEQPDNREHDEPAVVDETNPPVLHTIPVPSPPQLDEASPVDLFGPAPF